MAKNRKKIKRRSLRETLMIEKEKNRQVQNLIKQAIEIYKV